MRYEPQKGISGRRDGWLVVRLEDAPETVAVLAGWFRRAWPARYGPGGPGDAEAELRACLNRGSLPTGFVAAGGDRAPLGTACLKHMAPSSDTYPGPWLVGLFVAEPHRGRGIGASLVAVVEEEAGALGFPALYALAESGSTLLRRRGWNALGQVHSPEGGLSVFAKYLI